MLIEIATLPETIKQQILSVKNGETVQFTNNGEPIGQLKPSSINATAGLLAHYGVDGLEYERECREGWVRKWDLS